MQTVLNSEQMIYRWFAFDSFALRKIETRSFLVKIFHGWLDVYSFRTGRAVGGSETLLVGACNDKNGTRLPDDEALSAHRTCCIVAERYSSNLFAEPYSASLAQRP